MESNDKLEGDPTEDAAAEQARVARREFAVRLARAAIVPAVIATIAATSMSTASTL